MLVLESVLIRFVGHALRVYRDVPITLGEEMAKQIVSHTSGTSFPGAKGSAMKRGKSVVANEVAPGGSQRAGERSGSGGVTADGGGDKGASVSVRSTPENPHGLRG